MMKSQRQLRKAMAKKSIRPSGDTFNPANEDVSNPANGKPPFGIGIAAVQASPHRLPPGAVFGVAILAIKRQIPGV
jgi:hypothetical protein